MKKRIITLIQKVFYRGYHFTIEEGGKPVEVQIRTPAQTEFYEKAHDVLYKSKHRRMFTGAQLSELDTYAHAYSRYLVGQGGKPRKSSLVKRWFG